MESKRPNVFVPTYEEGIKRVLEGNYAFLMESTMLDYAVQRDCNLTQIGGLLDSKGYGIATPKGSPWRDKISLAILELQEKGIIQILYDKWWKNTGNVCRKDDKNKDSKANALGVENIGKCWRMIVHAFCIVKDKLKNFRIFENLGGVFVVLLCGLLLAIVVAIIEFCWNSRKNVQDESESVCSDMMKELQFAVKCHGSKQRPALKRICTKCNTDSSYIPAPFEMPIMNGVSFDTTIGCMLRTGIKAHIT